MRKKFQSSSGSLLFIKTSTITAISERKQQQQQNIGHATSKSVIRCFHKHRFVFEEDLKQMQLNEPGGKEKSEFLAEGEACKLISWPASGFKQSLYSVMWITNIEVQDG